MSKKFDGFFPIIPSCFIVLLSLASAVLSTVVIVDNTSPQVVYSPTPCYEDTPTACSIEWVLVELSQAFNGSVTSTNGPLPDPSNISVSILPRVTLEFTGSSISFFPGPNSTANASITLDDSPSIIIDTSRQSYQIMQLDDSLHTLVIDYLESDSTQTEPNVLEVDYFLVVQNEITSTSSSSSFSTGTPLISTSTSSTSSRTRTNQPTTSPLIIIGSKNRPSTGTIIAIAISASILLLAALLTWIWSAKRRRRRMAIKRENAILTGMRMPSEGNNVGGAWPAGVTIQTHTWKKKNKQAFSSEWT